MIILLPFILFGLYTQWLSIPLLSLMTLFTVFIFFLLVIIDQIYAKLHPLTRKINHALLHYERTIGKPINDRFCILHLAENAIHPVFSHQAHRIFYIKHQETYIQGYCLKQTFYLIISTPHQQLSSFKSAWQALGQTQLKFKKTILALHTSQLNKLHQFLEERWRFIKHLLCQSKQTDLLIIDEKLSNTAQFIWDDQQINTTITLTKHAPILNILHAVSQQCTQIIQRVFLARHTLLETPNTQQQKKNIFQIPHILARHEQTFLSAATGLYDHKIYIKNIYFWLKPHQHSAAPASTFSYKPVTYLLSIISCFVLTHTLYTQHQISQQLQYNTASENTYLLATLESYPSFKDTQAARFKHLKQQYLQNQTLELQPFFDYALSSQTLASATLDIIAPSLPTNLKHLLLKYWQAIPIKPPTLTFSTLAKILPHHLIEKTCYELFPDNPQCVQSMLSIQTYHQAQNRIETLKSTLLPIDLKDPIKSLPQLRYLAKHPEIIGETAEKEIHDIINSINTQPQATLLESCHNLLSLIKHLRSEEGRYILLQLTEAYPYLNASEPEAYQIVKQAMTQQEHPLNSLVRASKNFTPYEANWLLTYINPILNQLSTQTNQYLKNSWNQQVQPNLSYIRNHLPFNSKATTWIPLQAFYTLFGINQTIDQFTQQYLQPLLEETQEELRVKNNPFNLQIPETILLTLIYTKVLQSSIDIQPDHLHSALIVRLKEHTHPTESVILHHNQQKTKLSSKSQTIHWDSRYPFGIDIQLANGETTTLISDHSFSLLTFLGHFHYQKPYYAYAPKQHTWHITLDLVPQHAPSLPTQSFFFQLPDANWQ